MWRADAVLNEVCSLTINHHKLSSGIPTGYYHDVYAAHFNLRCFREKNLHNNAILRKLTLYYIFISMNVKQTASVEGCSAISATNDIIDWVVIILLRIENFICLAIF
ncbi:hypothetical protein T06_10807 [Trichinella sp. T6]|nr:hypothetical protein T06_10807 [Trichinella sp. T6]